MAETAERKPVDRFADALDRLNHWVGGGVRWFALAMMLLQFGIVLLRYVFGVSYVWLDESVLYLHSALFMLGAGYTLLVDGHVRVDIFFARFDARTQTLINAAGHVLLLLPAMILLLIYSWPSVRSAWAILEGPISVGGIPASFLLKSLIPAFCGLLIVQALACLLRDLARLGRGFD